MINEAEFEGAALRLNCEVATIKAVCAVEAPRGGMNPDGSPVTLFEGHKFYKYTKGIYEAMYPDLCYRVWTKKFYGKNWEEEKERLHRAMNLDKKAALLSTSWGKFQIMGFNYALCGFTDIEAFVAAMWMGEDQHLEAFCNYVEHTGLAHCLQMKDWPGFAVRYNGADFRANRYDYKLALEYEKASKS